MGFKVNAWLQSKLWSAWCFINTRRKKNMGNRIPKLQFCTHRCTEKAFSVGALPLSLKLHKTQIANWKEWLLNNLFFPFTGHMTYNKEYHDMTQYLWTEEEPEIFLSLVRRLKKIKIIAILDWSSRGMQLPRPPSRNEGGVTPRSRGKYYSRNNGKHPNRRYLMEKMVKRSLCKSGNSSVTTRTVVAMETNQPSHSTVKY